jgi:pimeloyl-ACP methyl ester carboxylesterase
MPTIDVRDATLWYEQHGSGPDIVWVSGGGGLGKSWLLYQVPFFQGEYRNTIFDNRGVGGTRSHVEPPWSIADLARDAAELIERVCQPPVFVAGLSMGGFITTELALSRPDLVRVAIAMGTAAAGHTGWLGDYMRAEIEYRKAGGRLEGLLGATHYAAQLVPARILGDEAQWAVLRERLSAPSFIEENEASLIGQWQACVDFDVRDRLASMSVPFHVFAFEEDVQAPPQFGEEAARLSGGKLHLFQRMGHLSAKTEHGHREVNRAILEILRSHNANP